MITKPRDYENARAFDGEFESIPVGGHICRIIGARVEKTQTGLDMLALQIEIADGTKLDGYYHRRFDSAKRNRPDAKWPGTYRTLIADKDGNTKGVFKGVVTSVEKSNPPYVWNWDEGSLKGKYIGFNYGEEEFQGNDGNVRTIVKPRFPLSVDRVKSGDYQTLECKKLQLTHGQNTVGGYSFSEQPGPNEEKLPWEE